ncbi:MAG TPA: DinB family protein [Gemmatimonadales bacterium]|nr:DinB family protein [Gemmatimonadales bacterium]
MIELLRRMLQYDVWANREALRSLRQGAPPPRSLRWFGHIIGAELLWLARMDGTQAQLPVWPELSLDQCEELLQDLAQRIPGHANTSSLARRVDYTNSKGERWTNTVEEILTHVVIHSAYHRGQIASDLRASGQEPAYTDYIHAIRHRLVE